jgi:hypothetical protein
MRVLQRRIRERNVIVFREHGKSTCVVDPAQVAGAQQHLGGASAVLKMNPLSVDCFT